MRVVLEGLLSLSWIPRLLKGEVVLIGQALFIVLIGQALFRVLGRRWLSDGNYAGVSPAKLVITERALDWLLNSIKDNHKKFESSSRKNSPAVEDGDNLEAKKPVRWQRVLNVFSFKLKMCEKKDG